MLRWVRQKRSETAMLIQFHGVSCVQFSTKVDNLDVSVLADPFGEAYGKLPKNLSADIALVSRPNHPAFNNVDAVKGDVFRIDHPGEFEVKTVPVYGIPARSATIWQFDMDGMRIGHLGGAGRELSDDELDRLGDLDILVVPVGGGEALDAKKAAELVSRIDPRAVIPVHFKMTGLSLKADGFSDFIKETGLKTESLDKWKVQRKDLPEEDTVLVILDKAS